MQKQRKARCWGCNSLDVIKWGKRQGKQRFRCKECGLLFTRSRPDISRQNRSVWFRVWIEGKQTIKQISKKSQYSERSLKRYFYEYLSNSPTWIIKRRDKLNLLIDGTYFPNKVCLVLYRESNIKATQLYRLTDGEWLEEIFEDLCNLLSIGIKIESVTCDGLSNIIKAIRRTSPEIIIQRCLAHIQREALSWLTRHPKTQAARDLRSIAFSINKITTLDERDYWIRDFMKWTECYNDFINHKTMNPESGRYWYTHRNLRRSWIHIKRALPDMFHYIDNPSIPKTTNSIESFFGHLKQNISLHRGLSKEHYRNYIKWYLFFRSNE